jgi:hypothetical protein
MQVDPSTYSRATRTPLDTIERFGMSNKEIADICQVTRLTVYNWYDFIDGQKKLLIPAKYCPMLQVKKGIRLEVSNPKVFTKEWLNIQKRSDALSYGE